VVKVLRDVGEMRKKAESAHDRYGITVRELIQDGFQFAPMRLIGVASIAHGQLSNGLDQLERGFAFLLTDYVAEQPA
jgi:hypothetical protein